MATLETLRQKGGILVAVFIGFALLAFIMMDFMREESSMFSASQNEVANINGTSVNIQEYQNRLNEVEEYTKLNHGVSSLSEDEIHMIRDRTWNQLVSQTILEEQYKQLGVHVTSEELMNMLTGKNIHPAIRQHPLFANPQTGLFDPDQVRNFLMVRQQDHIAYFYWMMLEQDLINGKLYEKYTSLIKKGMYIPSVWTDSELYSGSKMVDFEYIVARFTSVDDEEVIVNEREINKYYRENQNNYRQEASRDIEYLVFSIEATEEDRNAAQTWINNMLNDFSKSDIDPIQFVNLNSDEPFIDRNYKASELSSRLENFVKQASVGDIDGPYLENESYKITRLAAINLLPDSVRARHILLQEATLEESNKLADSLIQQIKSGSNFAMLARQYSVDQGSAINGGDLGWFTEGMMVKPFNDAVFEGKVGDIEKVETQYGIHIINIQQQGPRIPKYQIATLARNINYSSKTYQDVYSRVARFIAVNNTPEKFNEAAEEENITKRFGRNLKENDRNVGTLENSRELVRWAFESSVGSLSAPFEFGDQFVIAHLISATEEGIQALTEVKSQIERRLINDKKAALLKENLIQKINEGTNMETIAQSMDLTVQTAKDITFSSYQVPGAGVEPALVSLAVHSPINEISKPVIGNNGVYIVKVISQEENEAEENTVLNNINQNINTKVDYQLMDYLINEAKIVDNRSRFY